MTDSDRFYFERERLQNGDLRISGVDEAGRGPLAGPVVVAAVRFPVNWIQNGLPSELEGLNDSKAISEKRRDRFFEYLTESSELSQAIEIVEPEEIDTVNILQGTHNGMVRSLRRLAEGAEDVDHVLVDGLRVNSITQAQTPIVKGDSKSYSIAAASVLAKVTRDRIMIAADQTYPGYGFAKHKGYPTPAHLEALKQLGPCAIHRKSFGPVKQQQLELL